jgi:hypothetical protein
MKAPGDAGDRLFSVQQVFNRNNLNLQEFFPTFPSNIEIRAVVDSLLLFC